MSTLAFTAFIFYTLVTIVSSQTFKERCVPDQDTAFYISNVQLNFDSAKQYCSNMNATLVTLDGKVKADTVHNILKKRDGANSSTRFYWINVQDVDPNSRNLTKQCCTRNFVWVETGKCLCDTYDVWCPDEPNRDYEKCVDIEAPGKSYCWADVDCREKKYFVCERLSKQSSDESSSSEEF